MASSAGRLICLCEQGVNLTAGRSSSSTHPLMVSPCSRFPCSSLACLIAVSAASCEICSKFRLANSSNAESKVGGGVVALHGDGKPARVRYRRTGAGAEGLHQHGKLIGGIELTRTFRVTPLSLCTVVLMGTCLLLLAY